MSTMTTEQLVERGERWALRQQVVRRRIAALSGDSIMAMCAITESIISGRRIVAESDLDSVERLLEGLGI